VERIYSDTSDSSLWARADSGHVFLKADGSNDEVGVWLTPTSARTLASALLRLAAEVDGERWAIFPVRHEDAIPEPKVGQVWVSPSPYVEPRSVVDVGPRSDWGRYGTCVSFTTPTRPPSDRWGADCLPEVSWRKWSKMTGARPVPAPEGEGA